MGLAILWNVETGLGCLLGMHAYYLWTDVYRLKWQEKFVGVFAIDVLKNLVMAVMAILLPVIIVNIYNFCCGWEGEFWSFLSPFWW